MPDKKKIALKYCGGCNPGYDRVAYFREIQNAAGDLIEWVTLEDRDFESILLISGCDTECPADRIVPTARRRIVSVRDNKLDPAAIVRRLLSEVKS